MTPESGRGAARPSTAPAYPGVRLFPEKRGLERPEELVEALHACHAWNFAGRPIDAVALIAYWCERGRLGVLTGLIADDLARKRRETMARERVDPLSP